MPIACFYSDNPAEDLRGSYRHPKKDIDIAHRGEHVVLLPRSSRGLSRAMSQYLRCRLADKGDAYEH
jgi:hypothetical protein